MKSKFYDTLAEIVDRGFHCTLDFDVFGTSNESGEYKEIYIPNVKFIEGPHEIVLKKLIKKGDIKLPDGWKKIKKSCLYKQYCLGITADIPHEYYKNDRVYNKYLKSFIEWCNKYCYAKTLSNILDKYKEDNKENE